ncbi:phosphoadenylylsulfate reductase [Arthrobacter sp. PAMC 25486]|uniref:phosphoadenylyl-sulfate reductase n=1 Tax=Arthrobacter sp. PAMC 25486 TaxID=1494608 RepID=UPI000535D8F7|nr:phosphoadenylyl-sulfate reductase [Arthrobacter sp. PAMC 25486]AIY01879.1 phosphoadenylylsulfate reductase [Arthrobacter sp. PAMC 25486]
MTVASTPLPSVEPVGGETRTLRSHEELKARAAAGAAELDWNASAQEVIAWVARNFASSTAAVACSMADAVLPALVADQLPGVDVLFLDTGYHFPETYATRDAVAENLRVNIVAVEPANTVAEQDSLLGKDLFARDPAQCCALRKVEPLSRSLSGYELWFTGVRRDEAPTRTNTPLVVWDEKNGLVKVNPVADWTYDELISYSDDNLLPVNPLLSQGYPSIGCAPCTNKVAPGADPRSGRWAGTSKTECGLHV